MHSGFSRCASRISRCVLPSIGFSLVSTPGGGGYGNPFERDPDLVANDVRLGYYSAEDAAGKFGVAFDPSGGIDRAATAAKRGNAP